MFWEGFHACLRLGSPDRNILRRVWSNILDPICTILNHYFFCLSYFQFLALNLPLVYTPFCLHAWNLCWKIWVSHIDTYAPCVMTIWRWNPNPPLQTFQIDSLCFKAFSFYKIPKFEIIFKVGEGTSFLAFLGFSDPALGILPSARPSNPQRSFMGFITQCIKLSYLWLVLGDNFLQFFELKNMILTPTKDFLRGKKNPNSPNFQNNNSKLPCFVQ